MMTNYTNYAKFDNGTDRIGRKMLAKSTHVKRSTN